MSKVSTKKKLRTRIPDSFWGAMAIIGLSTLPYLHDIITDEDGLKSWGPLLEIEKALTDSNGNVLGFSTYRVFLYTLLIFVFAGIGWAGWFQRAKDKFYGYALLLATASGFYYIGLILFNLRRSIWNDPTLKFSLLVISFLILFFLNKIQINFRKVLIWILLFLISVLPFYHDILTDRSGAVRSWMPNFGLGFLLTDVDGSVYGFLSYRALTYFLCIHLFAHICWIGWFMDARGEKYRPFLLIPMAQSLYQLIIIIMSWWQSRLNDVDIRLYITIVLGIILAINFYYNNIYYPKSKIAQKNRTTIKSSENENRQK